MHDKRMSDEVQGMEGTMQAIMKKITLLAGHNCHALRLNQNGREMAKAASEGSR